MNLRLIRNYYDSIYFVFLLIAMTYSASNSFGQSPQIYNFHEAGSTTYTSDGFIDSVGNMVLHAGLNNNTFEIARINSDMSTDWVRRFETYTLSADGCELAEMPDNSIIGYINQDTAGYGCIFRLDINGNLMWHKYLSVPAGQVSGIGSILSLSNGSILSLVSNGSDGAPVVCLDNNGSLLWSFKPVPPAFYTANPSQIIQCQDGNILLLSVIGDLSLNADRFLFTKIDLNGNILSEKYFVNPSGFEHYTSMYESGDGSVFLTGARYETSVFTWDSAAMVVRKFDESLNPVAAKKYNSYYRDVAKDIIEDEDGNMIIVGDIRPNDYCGNNVAFIKLNPNNLDTLILRIYGETSGEGSSFNSLAEHGDTIYSFGTSALWDIMYSGQPSGLSTLALLDKSLHIPCKPFYQDLIVTDLIPFDEIITSDVTFQNSSPVFVDYVDVYSANILAVPVCYGPPLEIKTHSNKVPIVYPNPTDEYAIIDSSVPVKSVNVYDQHGKIIYETTNPYLELSGIGSGIYFVEVEDTLGEIFKIKLIKK